MRYYNEYSNESNISIYGFTPVSARTVEVLPTREYGYTLLSENGDDTSPVWVRR